MQALFIIVTMLSTVLPQEDWRLDKDKDGIRVYTREVEGIPIREFRVEAETSGTLQEISSLFRDVDNYASWMPDIKEASVIERVSTDIYIYHMIIGAPFPVTDRDLVTEMTFSESDDILRIDFRVMPDHIPEKDDHVRMQYFTGHWKFEREGDKTKITNRFLSDPGGSIPNWVINSFISRNPYNTIKNLKARLE